MGKIRWRRDKLVITGYNYNCLLSIVVSSMLIKKFSPEAIVVSPMIGNTAGTPSEVEQYNNYTLTQMICQ